MLRARITGTGSAVPDKVLVNADLEELADTTGEWITTRTSIKERRIAVSPEYLDLILLATVTPDFPFPATAYTLQYGPGAINAVVSDLAAASSGFICGWRCTGTMVIAQHYNKDFNS